MLEVVAELEANGRSLQHFARELARYFRNLLVAKIAGGCTELVAASPAEQERMLATAAQFSEEDLTRYLQLSLDLFRDLQSSLQPRLHLEMGLLRMVHAGRLQRSKRLWLRWGGGGAAAARRRASRAPIPRTRRTATPRPRSVDSLLLLAKASLRSRLHAALMESKHAQPRRCAGAYRSDESGAELIFTTPKMYQLYLKDPAFEAAVKRGDGRAGTNHDQGRRHGAPAGSRPVQKGSASRKSGSGTRRQRAMAHPEVQRFQECFRSQVRTVRNLKE